MTEETWKQIKNWPYEVSDHGRIRRSTTVGTKVRGSRPGRIRTIRIDADGYPVVKLTRSTADYWSGRVHTLVAASFLGPRPTGMQINHKSGIKTDNRPSNLEYVTHLENQQHASRSGLYRRGENHTYCKLNTMQVRTIMRLAMLGTMTMPSIGTLFGVSALSVSAIKHRRVWRHVTTKQLTAAAG